jgi:hypothetical protein
MRTSKKQDTQLRKRGEEARRLEPVGHPGTDHDTGQNLPGQAGLIEPFKEFVEEPRRPNNNSIASAIFSDSGPAARKVQSSAIFPSE